MTEEEMDDLLTHAQVLYQRARDTADHLERQTIALSKSRKELFLAHGALRDALVQILALDKEFIGTARDKVDAAARIARKALYGEKK